MSYEKTYPLIRKTLSDIPVKDVYTRDDLPDRPEEKPGEFPYTRGVHPDMYLGKLWTMRQFSGFATATETNQRYRFLLQQGQTGLSVAFDMPTLMGYDSDHVLSEGEVGKCGVAIDTLADMETLFDGIPLDQVSVSMTINGPAMVLIAQYLGVARKRGVPFATLRGTAQNDILKEYIAQKEWIFPPRPSMRIITDIMAWCAAEVPQYNTISISGYHIREAGSSAVQELAFTLADGFAYVEAGIAAGLDIDNFAPRLSFFFNAHQDFFEEIAKYRAARRIWAKRMRDKYHAKNPKSWLLRFHTQTAGCSLTSQQPENNIVRTAFEALSGVLGGTQSLHTNSMDETYALPTERSVEIALRTQQILAYETGVPHTVDPLAGSYYVEALTDRMEAEAEKLFAEIDRRGGVVAAIEEGWFQREIARSARQYQEEIERRERIIVGVNAFVREGEEVAMQLLKIDESHERAQKERLGKIKAERSAESVRASLEALRTGVRDGSNLMPPLLDCVEAYVTEGEICDLLREEFGTWEEPPGAFA